MSKNILRWSVLFYALVLLYTCNSTQPPVRPIPRDYKFDGSIERNVLESYLSRSMTMMMLLEGWESTDDNIRMLIDTGAKFAGRTFFAWGNESSLPGKFYLAKQIADRIHTLDPDIILQGCVFENITPDVGRLRVPAWAFAEFGLQPETRNFSYEAMLYKDGWGHDFFGKGQSVPDMTRPETKLWFFYAAKNFIDCGLEAIHFGQVEIMDKADFQHEHWNDLLTRVRAYAARNARRHLVLCDAHVHGGIVLPGGRLLFDFHSFPLRMEETDVKYEAELKMGHLDSIYGKSRGGVTPSGWSCTHLPYLVEFDNFEPSGKEGTNSGSHWIWGWDEITWFYLQSPEYRAAWLRYAQNWIAKNDTNGYLQMPGSRCTQTSNVWFFAVPKSETIPQGIDLSPVIKQLWAEDKR